MPSEWLGIRRTDASRPHGTLRQLLLAALAAVVLAAPSALHAQTSRADPDDFQARAGAELVLNLPRRWEVSLGVKRRYVNDASTHDGTYYSSDLAYETRGPLTLLGSHRLARTLSGDRHRLGGGVEMSRKIRSASLSGRMLVQYQRPSDTDDEQTSATVLRTRLRMKMPLGEWLTPYASIEPFFATSGLYAVDNWRNTAGLQLRVTKRTRLDAYFIYRPDYAKVYNRTFRTIGLDVSHERKLRW